MPQSVGEKPTSKNRKGRANKPPSVGKTVASHRLTVRNKVNISTHTFQKSACTRQFLPTEPTQPCAQQGPINSIPSSPPNLILNSSSQPNTLSLPNLILSSSNQLNTLNSTQPYTQQLQSTQYTESTQPCAQSVQSTQYPQFTQPCTQLFHPTSHSAVPTNSIPSVHLTSYSTAPTYPIPTCSASFSTTSAPPTLSDSSTFFRQCFNCRRNTPS